MGGPDSGSIPPDTPEEAPWGIIPPQGASLNYLAVFGL